MSSIRAPVADAKVNFSDLCAKMFAYTFLCLLDDGAIDITLTNRKALFGTKDQTRYGLCLSRQILAQPMETNRAGRIQRGLGCRAPGSSG
jgi:hypothetical protein